MTTAELLLRETVVVADAEVVEILCQLGCVIASHRHLHAWHGLLHEVPRVAHRLLAALVHGDAGLLKPPFLLQMPCERLEELRPQLLISGAVGLRLQVDVLLREGIEVAERHVPRHHREAVDLLVDAARVAEFHVVVEHRVVVAPRAVLLARRAHHCIELVVALCAPRLIEEHRRDDLLTRPRQQLQVGAQQVVVLLAPSRHVVEAAHAVGLLPVVQMELLLLWAWQRAVDHFHSEGQAGQRATRFSSHHLQLPLVAACLARVGHFQRTPQGAQPALVGLLAPADDVGHEVGWQVVGMVAAGVETIREHPPQEVGLGLPLAGSLAFRLQAERKRFAGGIGLHHRLQSHALAAPGLHRGSLLER